MRPGTDVCGPSVRPPLSVAQGCLDESLRCEQAQFGALVEFPACLNSVSSSRRALSTIAHTSSSSSSSRWRAAPSRIRCSSSRTPTSAAGSRTKYGAAGRPDLVAEPPAELRSGQAELVGEQLESVQSVWAQTAIRCPNPAETDRNCPDFRCDWRQAAGDEFGSTMTVTEPGQPRGCPARSAGPQGLRGVGQHLQSTAEAGAAGAGTIARRRPGTASDAPTPSAIAAPHITNVTV